ncbi:V8-like Glu-specific endopeptidase [Mycobacterium basiliense]|uniref:V8-like Glu-specific endopeptidase n=1 Tax=Mycobacterium basiliense TaxID=2094119 RepID=A0A447GDL9_9MYCO|nr:S1 family peptidase [Mycobacterium basiliense]VDM88576.1 V8-like Glu-specific endopeptidase [Mycobacterium basiliense]
MVRVSARELSNVALQQSPARTALLVVGALLCLAVAAGPFLANRIQRNRDRRAQVFPGTDVPYSAPERRRTDGVRLSIVALVCAVAFVAFIWTPGRTATTLRPPIPLPSTDAIGPGAGIAVSYADGSGGMGCTAGFLVRTSTGKTGVLTAGHCNKPGEASKVSINYTGTSPYVIVGTFNQTISEGLRGEAHDIGLIVLDSGNVPRTSAIAASLPVTGVADNLRIGQQLCKFGMRTGRAECGQITDVTDSKVEFLAASQCGDSGGPVYAIQNDGSAIAVGIHIRAGRPNDPNPGCSIPATFSIAELVRPWLDKWNLTPLTGPN